MSQSNRFKKNNIRKHCTTIAITLFALALLLEICACSPQQQTTPSQTTSELYGSPWVTSVFTGNLPASQPDAKDDLYLHYAYDYAREHQNDSYASVADDESGELQSSVTAAIKDSSISTPDMEQLRMFYNQAADVEAREAAGAEEIKPYLKAIADTNSLDELETLLLSESFPFSPWIDTTVSAADMKSEMLVAVMPNMLFSNSDTGNDFYQDAEDERTRAAYETMKYQSLAWVRADIEMLSIEDDSSKALEKANAMFDLEKSYGKYTNDKQYLNAEYGGQAQAVKTMTLDEFESICPNFPIRKTLAKLGEDKNQNVIVMYPEWISAFNEMWTEENFELLRDMTEVKVLQECADFLPPSFYSGTRQELGQSTPTADEWAYTACDRTDTFTQLLAETYVEQELGMETATQLENLSNELIDEYIELVGDTPWLNEQSRENVIEKIDNMALNILYPDGGYFDYSGLSLVSSENGGTLFGNYLIIKAYNDKLEAELVGKTARASATWLYMKPTTQNCFYDSVSNSINIFPGYITHAVYTKDMSREELLAGIGFAIGHEISHAFDYTGSQFNAYGQHISVFTDADVEEFVAKRRQIADYYSTFEVNEDMPVNGMEKSAEATADLCGMQVILARAQKEQGFDYEKMFGFFAHSWAMVASPDHINILSTESHALNNQRVNATAQMFEEFYNAYDVSEGDVMHLSPERRITMWG